VKTIVLVIVDFSDLTYIPGDVHPFRSRADWAYLRAPNRDVAMAKKSVNNIFLATFAAGGDWPEGFLSGLVTRF